MKGMPVSTEQLSGSAREDATHFCGNTAGSWDSRAFPKLMGSISSLQGLGSTGRILAGGFREVSWPWQLPPVFIAASAPVHEHNPG